MMMMMMMISDINNDHQDNNDTNKNLNQSKLQYLSLSFRFFARRVNILFMSQA